MRGGVEGVVALVARQRRREEDLAHPRDLGRDRRHEHARGVARLAAGRVHPGARDRQDAGAELASVGVGEAERLGFVIALALVEDADAPRGDLERGARRRGKAREGSGAGIVAPDEGGRAALVEPLGEVEDGGVAPFAHGGEDRADVGLDAGEVRFAPGAEPRERRVAVGRAIEVGAQESVRAHRADGCSTRASSVLRRLTR